MGLIRFILFALFFYLIYFLIKYIFVRPFREGYKSGDQKRTRGFQNPFQNKKEGDISISYDPRKDRKTSSEVGEYVEYEEVKDSESEKKE